MFLDFQSSSSSSFLLWKVVNWWPLLLVLVPSMQINIVLMAPGQGYEKRVAYLINENLNTKFDKKAL